MSVRSEVDEDEDEILGKKIVVSTLKRFDESRVETLDVPLRS